MALDPGLSHAAFRLAAVLMHYEGEQGCFPSQQRLAEHLGISLDSVQRYLRELELYGFLIRERRYRKTNRYTLVPVYEPPLAHGSFETTGSLEIQNDELRRPPSPRTLRRSKVKATTIAAPSGAPPVSLDDARQVRGAPTCSPLQRDTAPVRPLNLQRGAADTAPVRLVKPPEHSDVAAPMPLSATARVRLYEPHECGSTNNIPIQEPQHHNNKANSHGVGNELRNGLLSLRTVGVNLVEREVGVHLSSGLQLSDNELIEWANWVASGSNRDIRNKPAFCATKIRLGFALADVFPSIAGKRRADGERSDHDSLKRLNEKVELETTIRADEAIAAMTPADRTALRELALDDGAVRLARDLSPDLLARLILAAERRIVLGNLPKGVNHRDHRSYKALPPL
jgi:biotin operon repressor